ncbi:MAG: hypothetical protein LIQ31_04370 [Planctomycetes bacterium]|nr:hypothetical protein [Planctomycetota bacterium]
MRTSTARLALLLVMAVVACAVSVPAFAGQPAPNLGSVPPRTPKVKEGDWVLYKTPEGFRLETAVGVEPQEGGDVMVTYTMQDVQANGRMEEPMEVVRTLSQEREELVALAKTLQNPRLDRRAGQIDGKRVSAYVLMDVREGFVVEYWYSDEFTIDGQVMMQIVTTVPADPESPESDEEKVETEKMFEVVAFGNARSPIKNIRRYLR